MVTALGVVGVAVSPTLILEAGRSRARLATWGRGKCQKELVWLSTVSGMVIYACYREGPRFCRVSCTLKG